MQQQRSLLMTVFKSFYMFDSFPMASFFQPPPAPPEFPPFPIKACVLGKTFSGKTSVCRKMAECKKVAEDLK